MPLAVIDGAVLRCDRGTKSSELTVTNATTANGGGKRIASILDHNEGENIRPFGTCTLVGQPCVPQTPAPWFPGAREVQSCSLRPPLSSDSFLLCVAHGPAAITVEDPGQSSLVLPKNGIVQVPFGPYYYIYRHYDFIRRNPGMTPPDYYLEYGNKFLNLFNDAEFSNRGEKWVKDVMRDLQEAIEELRRSDPEGFAALERDGAAFRKFAFDTHPEIYRENGALELSRFDQAHILKIILGNTKLNQMGENAEQFAEFFKQAIGNPGASLGDLLESHFYQTPKHVFEETIGRLLP